MQIGKTVVLAPRRVCIVLAGIAAIIIGVATVLGVAKRFWWGGDPFGLVNLFRLNGEGNIPSYFSGGLLALNAGLLALAGQVRTDDGRRRRVWALLACVFLFLSFDELFEVHEALIEPLRGAWNLSGLLYFAWLLVYVPLAALMAPCFCPSGSGLARRTACDSPLPPSST